MNPTEYETALRAEIAAIRRIVAALDKLDATTAQRVAEYVFRRYHEKAKQFVDETNAKIEQSILAKDRSAYTEGQSK